MKTRWAKFVCFIFCKLAAFLLATAVLAGQMVFAGDADFPVLSDRNLAKGARVRASSVYGKRDEFSGAKLADGDLSHNSRWAAASRENCYVVIELNRVSTFNRVKVYEDIVHGERVTAHVIEYWDGEGFKTAAQGSAQGAVYTDSQNYRLRLFDTVFNKVSTDKVRIRFDSSNAEGPAIREVEILNETGEDVVASQITVNGKPLDGFSPVRFDYDVVVEKGGGIPTVEAEGCEVTQAESLPGCALVKVKSGKLENVYTINFWEDKGFMVNEIIPAHKFSEKSGVVQNTLGPDGSSVGNFEKGGYLRYNSVDFGDGQAKVLMAVASSTASGQLEIRIDRVNGRRIGTIEVNTTGSAYNFSEHYAGIERVTGVHDLYIVSKNELPVNLDTLVISSFDGTETEEEKNERMSAWRNARYGQFIHFGVYANFPFERFDREFNGYSEWIMYNWNLSRTEYEELAVSTFNPTDFDARRIVEDAKGAGVKYMVFTSKHHEGYSMYDTKVKGFRDFSLFGYGLYEGEDPILKLSQECKKADIIFGCYYSIMDWRHWTQNSLGAVITDKAAYLSDMKAQLRELIEFYDVDILWFDGEWNNWWTTADGKALYRYLRTLKPSLIINNRIGKRGQTDGDFGTPEQEIPADGLGYDWESCITMNNSWGYLAHDTDWKSVRWIITSLADTASKGGNMLLNVGPDSNGVVPAECIERLKAAGEWLEKYGESIYGTQASPFSGRLPFGVATRKEGRLYLHVTDWPDSGKLIVPAIENKINSVYILGHDTKLPYAAGEGYILIELPKAPVDEYDTVVVVNVEGDPRQSEKSYLSDNLAKGKKAVASNYYFNNPEYDGSKAVDGNPATRWATDDHIRSATLEIDLGSATEFNMIVLSECVTWGPRVGRFNIEYWDGNGWQVAASAEGMGENKALFFDTVKSTKVRLNILGLLEGANKGPTIYEVQVYNIKEIPMLKGDLNGDGRLTVTDIVKLRSHIMNDDAGERELLLGDLNNDGKLTVSDIVGLRRMIMQEE
ncbi:MAG TPA: carbohydrate-binding protein [Clostridiales bacterium]|nr:carbohydrate-binding protein [Clostridiales bacterium]